jgi:hypothetical protein
LAFLAFLPGERLQRVDPTRLVGLCALDALRCGLAFMPGERFQRVDPVLLTGLCTLCVPDCGLLLIGW